MQGGSYFNLKQYYISHCHVTLLITTTGCMVMSASWVTWCVPLPLEYFT